jgi:hypothetical protein
LENGQQEKINAAIHAGKHIRYALVVVDLLNRRPMEIVRDEFGFLNFDD